MSPAVYLTRIRLDPHDLDGAVAAVLVTERDGVLRTVRVPDVLNLLTAFLHGGIITAGGYDLAVRHSGDRASVMLTSPTAGSLTAAVLDRSEWVTAVSGMLIAVAGALRAAGPSSAVGLVAHRLAELMESVTSTPLPRSL